MAEEKSKLATAIEHIQFAGTRLGELTASYRAAKQALTGLQVGSPVAPPADLRLQIVVGANVVALDASAVPPANMTVMLSSTCDCLANEIRATLVAAQQAAADGVALIDATSEPPQAGQTMTPQQPPTSVVG